MSKTALKFRSRPPVEGFARDADGLHEPVDERAEFQPTIFLPGDDRKIDLMGLRYASGLPVFHPEDRQRDEDDRSFATAANSDPLPEADDD